MLRDRIFPVATQERDLVEVAGGTLEYRVRVHKNGGIVPFLKAYSVDFYIARYDTRTPIISVRGIYVANGRYFLVRIPEWLTRQFSGAYTYQIKITMQSGREIFKNYGHVHFIQYIR